MIAWSSVPVAAGKSNSRVLMAVLQDDKPQLSISTLAGSSTNHPDLPPEINQLAATFPHGPPEVPIYDLQDLVSGYLPQYERAVQLRDLYLEQAPWFFGAVTQRQLFEEIFPLFYEQARTDLARGQFGASAEAFNLQQAAGAGLPHASSHELALMFVVFCFGALTDPELPPAPHNEEAARYYQLTRAALSLEPVMDRPPSVATVQVLSLMGIYMVRVFAAAVCGRRVDSGRGGRAGHGCGRSQHRVHLVSDGTGFQTRPKRECSSQSDRDCDTDRMQIVKQTGLRMFLLRMTSDYAHLSQIAIVRVSSSRRRRRRSAVRCSGSSSLPIAGRCVLRSCKLACG